MKANVFSNCIILKKEQMKIRKKTMYDVVFWTFVAITIVCYFLGLYSLVRWIISLF